MYERFFDPGLAEADDQDEEQEMDERHDEEGQSRARVVGQPEGEGEREEHQYGDDDEEKEDCQGGRRHQAYHLVNHIELDIFRLKPEVMFQHLDQLGKRLNVLVAGQHQEIYDLLIYDLRFTDLLLFSCVLDIVHEVHDLLTAEFDVVLLQEALHSVCNFHTGVLTLLGGHENTQGCAGDCSAKECSQIT